MTPGTYLRKRREARGLTLAEAAGRLAARWNRPVSPAELARLEARFAAAEADRAHLDHGAAIELSDAVPLDPRVYVELVDLHADARCGLPEPQVCRECACSWHDPCLEPTADGLHRLPCAWADPLAAPDEALCTACERRLARAPLPGPAAKDAILHLVPAPGSVPARVTVTYDRPGA